jgi:hypothetical protein
MNTMNIPGFTAETSLFKRTGIYSAPDMEDSPKKSCHPPADFADIGLRFPVPDLAELERRRDPFRCWWLDSQIT